MFGSAGKWQISQCNENLSSALSSPLCWKTELHRQSFLWSGISWGYAPHVNHLVERYAPSVCLQQALSELRTYSSPANTCQSSFQSKGQSSVLNLTEAWKIFEWLSHCILDFVCFLFSPEFILFFFSFFFFTIVISFFFSKKNIFTDKKIVQSRVPGIRLTLMTVL